MGHFPDGSVYRWIYTHIHGILITHGLVHTAHALVQTAIHTSIHSNKSLKIWNFTQTTLLIHIRRQNTVGRVPISISIVHRRFNHSIQPLWTQTVISTSSHAWTRSPSELNFVCVQYSIIIYATLKHMCTTGMRERWFKLKYYKNN